MMTEQAEGSGAAARELARDAALNTAAHEFADRRAAESVPRSLSDREMICLRAGFRAGADFEYAAGAQGKAEAVAQARAEGIKEGARIERIVQEGITEKARVEERAVPRENQAEDERREARLNDPGYAVGYAQGRAEERAAIGAWLREHGTIGGKYEKAADAIESGAADRLVEGDE